LKHFNPSARRGYELLPLKSEKSNRLVLLASGPRIEHKEGKPLSRGVTYSQHGTTCYVCWLLVYDCTDI